MFLFCSVCNDIHINKNKKIAGNQLQNFSTILKLSYLTFFISTYNTVILLILRDIEESKYYFFSIFVIKEEKRYREFKDQGYNLTKAEIIEIIA